MDARNDNRNDNRPTTDQPHQPATKRFRLVKLEDRIAPRGGNGNTHAHSCDSFCFPTGYSRHCPVW